MAKGNYCTGGVRLGSLMDEDLPLLKGKEGEISPDSRGCLQRVRSTLEGKG